jgi:hypothetical protein
MSIRGGLPSVRRPQRDESARVWDESGAPRKLLGRIGQIQGRIGRGTWAGVDRDGETITIDRLAKVGDNAARKAASAVANTMRFYEAHVSLRRG